MQTLILDYENISQLILFYNTKLFREQLAKSRLLVIQIMSEMSDSYTISRVIKDLRTLFPDVRITGNFPEKEEDWTSGKIRLYFTFSETENISTVLNISDSSSITNNSEIEYIYSQLVEKNRIIESINLQVTDSLKYASKIQKAMIPADSYFNKIFPQNFIIFKPKHYVSGDFYWLYEVGNKIFFAVADCTGHGVPGALMSILGITCLNEIGNLASQSPSLTAADILNLLRSQIKSSLHQDENYREMQNGMDIALCILDREKLNLQYAGALIPFYVVRDHKLFEYKPNRMPIGDYEDMSRFTDIDIKLETGDMIYLFTDGYTDQFGGAINKKFLRRNFRELLAAISGKQMDEQKEILKDTLEIWQNGMEQIDDITGIGIKIENQITGLYSI
jgi:serine phosphatase RsbU (regulator of sigma subunit)